MKIRMGFVSNSSSSSFVCDICGLSYETVDGDYSNDVKELNCTNGHTICSPCVDFTPQRQEELLSQQDYSIEEIIEQRAYIEQYGFLEWCNRNDIFYNDIDPCLCDVCQFKTLLSKDYLKLFKKDNNIQNQEILKTIQERFLTYEDFRKYLRGT